MIEDQVSSLSQEKSTSAITVAKNAGLGLGGGFISVLLRLTISIVITRSIGPESFGIYVLAIAILTIAEIIALLGMENTIVKFISQFRALNDIPRLRGAIFWGIGLVLTLSTAICIGLFCMSHFLGSHIFDKPSLVPILKIMAFSIPVSSLGKVLIASLQGIKLIKYKVLVQQVLIPSSRLICVVLTIAFGYQLVGIAWSYVMAEVLGIIYSAYFLFKSFPEIRQKSLTTYEMKKITFFSLPLLFSGMFNRIVARADILIMGHFLSATMVGIYGIAQRFLPLIMMPLGAFNSIFAPIISDLFARKRKEDLETQFKTVAKWVFMASLPIFMLFTFFSKEILSIFGSGFVAGSLAMMILCAGQMVNTATGSVGFVLMMTGRPFADLLNSGLLCVTNILLNIYLIPRYGIVGAACASAFSITAIQLLRLAEVWCFLRMHPYRWDFFKPLFSGLFAVSIVTMLSHSVMSTAQIFGLPILVTLFLLSYVGFLWLLKLSPDDHLVLNCLRRKLFGQKGQQMKYAESDQGR